VFDFTRATLAILYKADPRPNDAAAAAAIAGREGDVMRSLLKWSIGLVAIMCVLVYLQSTAVLSWMVP
jgi:hypothetical protein